MAKSVIAALALGAWAATQLGAQNYGAPQVHQLWWQGGLLTEQDESVTVEGAPGKAKRTFPKGPLAQHQLDAFDHQLWVTQRQNRPEGAFLALFSSSDGKDWHPEGTLPVTADERPIRLWPLQRDRFLAAYSWELERDKQASPLAILHRREGHAFEVESLCQPGFKGRLRVKDANGDRVFSTETDLLSLTWGSTFVRTPTALVVYSATCGYFWVVDTTKERPSLRFAALYPAFKGAWLDSGQKLAEVPVLAVQPRPDGHVLIAARTEEAVFHAREEEAQLFLRVHDPKVPPAEHQKTLKERAERRALKAHGGLVWWDFDPATLRFTKEPAPPGAPERFENLEQLRRFTFRLKPNGDVQVPK